MTNNNTPTRKETKKSLSKWKNHIDIRRIPVFKSVLDIIKPHGNILEIGAGSSWLSAKLSKINNVTRITSIEINKSKIDIAKKYVLKIY